MADPPLPDVVPENLPSPSKPGLVNDRYRILRPLGRGGMGTVFLAMDAASGDQLVALKRIRKDRLDMRAVSILRNEFLALASLRHPNLVRAYDFATDQETDDLFFTSEYVNGIHWLKAVEQHDLSTAEGLETFLGLLAQVLRALEFIHCRGMVHADIKPENVLVTARQGDQPMTAADLGVKLIDFGLAKRQKAAGGKKILGTPYYVAPETILGSPMDRRTDLYSLGIVLYQLTTGTQPFHGASNLEILKCHLERTAPPPHEHVPNLPRPLSDVVVRLMEKKPADRFQGALEALDALNRAFGSRLPLETPETRQSYLGAACLVGREAELNKLRAVFHVVSEVRAPSGELDEEPPAPVDAELARAGADAHVPAGRLVVLRGEKGLGKRRLIEELRHIAQTQGASWHEIECLPPGEAGTGGPASLERSVAELLRPREQERAVSFASSLVSVLSRLQARPAGATSEMETALEDAAWHLLRLSREQPLVIHCHDLHAASAPLLRFLGRVVKLLAEGKAPGSRLLLTAAALDRVELEAGPFRDFCDSSLYHAAVEELKLTRLGAPDVDRWIHIALEGLDCAPAFVQRVMEESDGHPVVIAEILKFLIDRGKITRLPLGWALSPDYENEDIPGKVRRELKERLASLPKPALALGMAFACLGEKSQLKLAAQLSGLQEKVVPRAIQQLCAAKVLQSTGHDGGSAEYGFVHSSARVTLYGRIPAADAAGLHERAGDLLEAQAGQGAGRLQSLAHHYLLSGNKEKSLRYGLEAARELARELSPLRALELYEKVLGLAGSDDPSVPARVTREMAALRFQVGDYRGALELLEPIHAGRQETGLPGESWPAHLEAARAHARLGQFQPATMLLNRSLRQGKDPGSLAELAPIMFVLAELHFFKGNFIESLRCCGRLLKSGEEINDARLLAPLYLLAAENNALLNNMDFAVSYCQLALRIIESRHDALHLAWSLHARGKYYAYKHQHQKALRQLQLCAVLRKKMNDLEGEATVVHEGGAIELAVGNPAAAKVQLEQALGLYRKSGSLMHSVSALCLLAEASRLAGDYDACHEATVEALRRMEPLQTRRWTLQTQLTLAWAALDRGELGKAGRFAQEAEVSCTKGAVTPTSATDLSLLLCELAYQKGDLAAALLHSRRSVLDARELKDPVLLSRASIAQAVLLCGLGRMGEARRLVVTLHETAERHELPRVDGWVRLIEGLVLADDGKLDAAEASMSQAGEALVAQGCERDMIQIYLEQGLLALRRGSFEQAYLNLEEGLHLAEKLQLSRARCRYHFAMGLLESALPESQLASAEESFAHAEKLAAAAPHPEVGWQVQYHWGKLLFRAGRKQEAMSRLSRARDECARVLQGLTDAYAQSYRRAMGAEELDAFLEEAAGVAAAK